MHASVEDVAGPFDSTGCDCDDFGADGLDDMALRFSTAAMTQAFELDALDRGTSLMLSIRGTLFDGTPFQASDCVTIIGPSKQLRTNGRPGDATP